MKIYIPLQLIEKIICQHFEMTSEILFTKTRKRTIVEPRQIFHFFSRKYSKNSLAAIGDYKLILDHATILHSCGKVENLCDVDAVFRKNIEKIDSKLRMILINDLTDEEKKFQLKTNNLINDIISCENEEDVTNVLSNNLNPVNNG